MSTYLVASGTAPAVEMAGITRRFGSTLALSGVDFALAPGEIHALLGENGAGKTTLVNILYGLLAPDAGRIALSGRPARIASPRAAMAQGLGMVHQHFMLVPGLSVVENLVLGAGGGRGWRLDLASARRRLAELCETHQFQPLPPDRDVASLSVGEQQRLEILKSLHRSARVLILDEPTAVLAPQETDELFAALSRLRARGHSLVFISHKLEEIRQLCDRVTILRKGKSVATLPVSEAGPERLAELMVGHGLPPLPERTPMPPGEVVLELRELVVRARGARPALDRVSLGVHAGEIVGIAGVDGNGQAELEDVLAGVLRPTAGDVMFCGQLTTRWSAERRHREGWAQVASDRQATGLVGKMSIEENLAVRAHRSPPFSRRGFLSRRNMRLAAADASERYAIAGPSPDSPIESLSGGNQQKVVLARELLGTPRLLVACSPTRGLDVGATRFVHETLLARRKAGAAILLVSSELDEILALSDRVAVLARGRFLPVPEEQRSREAIGRLMLGEAP